MANADRSLVVVYLPTGDNATLAMPSEQRYQARWFDPRSGEWRSAALEGAHGPGDIVAPGGTDEHGHPWDWVLVLDARAKQ